MASDSSSLALHSWPGRRILALLCAVAFLDFVDASITNVALPHILAALHFSVQSLQWVPSAYLLTYGGFMLLGGRLADLLGRRNVLLAGTLVVGLSSLAGGLAGDAGVFIAARLAQGLGAALMLPAALSALTTTFTAPRDRQSALGVWAAVAGLSSAVGILLGGILTEGPGWRWVMFVNPLACLLVIPAVLALLPRDRPAAQTTRFDLLGSAMVTGGMVLLVYALIQAPGQGWGAARTWWELAGAAALLAAFVLRERYARDPVLPLSIFRVPGLAAANLTGLIGFAGMLSMFYFLTLYMQRVLGYSPVVAGAAYLPLTFGVGIAAGVSAKLLTRVGSRAVICAGALIAAAGLFLLGQVPTGGGYLLHILPGLLLVAFGVGPVFVGVTTAANAGVGPGRAGLAAAILNSCQQLGGALGLAIFSAVGTAQVHHLLARGIPAPDATTAGIRHALMAGAAFAAAAALIALATRNTHQTDHQGDLAMNASPANQPARILVVGRSPNVLLDTVEILRGKGYSADATNQFDHVLDDYDARHVDIVVFGGMVPAGTKEHLRREIGERNSHVTFVQGLAGIAGLIAAQVEGVIAAGEPDQVHVVYHEDQRSVGLTLHTAAHVTVEAWWATSFTPPEPTSTSLRVLDTELGEGSHTIALPAAVPPVASFLAVTAGSAVRTLVIGAMPQSVMSMVPAGGSSGAGSSTATSQLPPVSEVNTRSYDR
jgi:EmrB/QacA subfamily drug resistance transporter